MTEDERQDAPQDDAPEGGAPDEALGGPAAEQPDAPGPAGGESAAEAAAEAPGAEEVEEGTAEQPAAAQAGAEGSGRADGDAQPAAAAAGEVGDDDASAGEPRAEDAGDEAPTEEAAEAGEPGAPAERVRQERPKKKRKDSDEPAEEVIPGAHLEPDLVLDEAPAAEEHEFARYEDDGGVEDGEPSGDEDGPAAEPVVATPLALAADARYMATGKRKTSVARVILKPGRGRYWVNGRRLEQYFPRPKLQHAARQPLEVTRQLESMDVVARIHGGGVAAQAEALRHGIARALVEADPNLRGELKRRGFLTRDPRVKERKKAGLKKARKRPQFSKR
jgi:small subunit ribosomal protein S9